MKALSLAIGVFSIAFSSCAKHPLTKSELWGTYNLSSQHFKGTLELRSDDSFSQRYILSSGTVQTATGRWSYDPALTGRHGVVILHGGILENAGHLLKKPEDFLITLPIDISWKRISLFLTPDGNHEYTKPR
jgi:hypothetical protein